jgi:hypothetical protein
LQHSGSYYVNWCWNQNVSGQQRITFDTTDIVCTYICMKDLIICSRTVFHNRWAAARYRALASIIPGRENLSF